MLAVSTKICAPEFRICAGLIGFGVQHSADKVGLRADNDGRVGFHNAGFFAGDTCLVAAQKFGMIHIDGCYCAAGGGDDIGGVIASAEADFYDADISSAFGEGKKSGGCSGFKKRERLTCIGLTHAGQNIDEAFI